MLKTLFAVTVIVLTCALLTAAPPTSVDLPIDARHEITRRGDHVQELGTIQAGPESVSAQALAPPEDDSDHWFITVVITKDTKYAKICDKLVGDFRTAQPLKPWVNVDEPMASWVHRKPGKTTLSGLPCRDHPTAEERVFRFEQSDLRQHSRLRWQPCHDERIDSKAYQGLCRIHGATRISGGASDVTGWSCSECTGRICRSIRDASDGTRSTPTAKRCCVALWDCRQTGSAARTEATELRADSQALPKGNSIVCTKPGRSQDHV